MAPQLIGAGQALQRLWPTARLHGLQASHLNQQIEIVPWRSELEQAIGRPGLRRSCCGRAIRKATCPPCRALREGIEVIE
jgi:hypothetical protein